MDDGRVNHFVASFQTRMHASLQEALERSGQYRARIVAILAREGLPTDLCYLPLIESGFRTRAVSRAGAVGLWQLIPGTGRLYGLRIDAYVDERRDPVRASRAAARYLRDLYAKFGNWHLALAAYNLGPARLARLLAPRRHQPGAQTVGPDALPAPARNYVWQFVAALQIARAPQRHGFDRSAQVPVRYDIVRVRPSLSLRDVASMAGVSVAEIAELNPALIQRITPPDGRGYPMRLPRGAKARFEIAYARMAPGPIVEAAAPDLAIVAPAPSPAPGVDARVRLARR